MNWKIQFLLILLLLINFAVEATSQKPTVKIPEYSAFGFQNTTKNGISANIFLGLPYAKPPINELRFEKTETLPLNPTKIVDATNWPPPCHQVADITHWGYTTSEDCLYLNIFTPTKISNKTLLPVFVFIHGGGFEYGYTQAYGYEYFVDNFISQNIIMAFFATRDHVINGNFGHFDQIEALKFIKRNIAAFGGDPNQITLSGHSAGSLSVHTLSLTPLAKDLFKREVHIAGSNYCQFAIDTQFVFNHSELIGNAVGCTQKDTNKKKACLKKLDYQKFWEVRKQLNLSDFPYETKDILYWTSVYDNDIFDGKDIDELQAIAEKTEYFVWN
uniref:Carboxylic ester hydrolase n=1 Tax=Panagrolaimus superbus TaxID=310955 RepID=A0A914Y4L0_9BILA